MKLISYLNTVIFDLIGSAVLHLEAASSIRGSTL